MQQLPPRRCRFSSGIVADFLPPDGLTHNKVVIITPGAPWYPGAMTDLWKLLSERGYFTFVIRYRGTWESQGMFLEHSPHEDILQVIDELSHGFRDTWSTAEYRIHNPEVYLIGGSFGGAAAILASRDERVKKAVAISAVVDWRMQEHTVEPLDLMDSFVREAFGPAYRPIPDAYKKLAQGDFYNPQQVIDSIHGDKLLLIHSKDDKVVPFAPAEAFAKKTGATFIPLNNFGHMGAGSASLPKLWNPINRFFSGKKVA